VDSRVADLLYRGYPRKPDLLEGRSVYYTPKGEEWRISAHKLIEKASQKSGGWNDGYERLQGDQSVKIVEYDTAIHCNAFIDRLHGPRNAVWRPRLRIAGVVAASAR
jgi:hypothetical protein